VPLVRITLNAPGSAGNIPAPGGIRATPTRRRTVADAIVLPVRFTAQLTAGETIVELAPTGADWCWRIEEMTPGGATRYVAVPESSETLGYEDLVDVDPDTLDPAAEPEAAWYVALTAALRTVMHSVTVVTGSEPRPDTTASVVWFDTRVDQSTAPTNKADIDIWETGAVTDTTAPTVPTGLASSSITDTGFTVSWTASTDAFGVTGYRVLLDGVQYALPTGTSQVVTGRTASTAYDVTVQARDAAGNWSAESAVLTVTTSANTLPTHSVFATPPGVLVKSVEASAYEHATGFYTHTAGAAGWKVKGARLYVPDGITVPTTCEVNLYAPGTGTPTLGTPTKTVTMTGITSNAWTSVNFPSVTAVNPGEVWWIGIKFADGTWLGVSAFGEGFVAAADGSTLVLGDRSPAVGLDRNYRRIGTGSTVALTAGERDVWFGMDAIVEED
jgi:chitodextrinase